MPKKLLIVVVWLLFAPACVHADPQSQSYSSWKLLDDQLRMRYTVSAREVSRLSSSRDEKVLRAALLQHLSATVAVSVEVSVADSVTKSVTEKRCKPQLPGKIKAAKRGYVVAELLFNCANAPTSNGRVTVVINTLFDRVPSHIHFARFLVAEQDQQEFLFTQHQRAHTVPWSSAAPGSAAGNVLDAGKAKGQGLGQEQEPDSNWKTVRAYLVLGFQHILEGADHIVFLLALLLLANSARDILLIVTGFTLGHSITLTLAALNIVHANTDWVESMIGLTIALVAVENVAARSVQRKAIVRAVTAGLLLLALLPLVLPLAGFSAAIKSPPMLSVLGLALFSFCYLSLSESPQRAMRYRPAITILFGLVHGFGFANVLQEVGMPSARVPAALFGFNLGVEFGQLAIVLCLSGVGFVVLKIFKNSNCVLASDLLSAILCAVGSYWFIQRAYV